ncbi:hypothetical protein AWB71_05333 [Caballeronia peredens]|nr:hypothetical protein AWB71_05333 [Caballeronia peredens]
MTTNTTENTTESLEQYGFLFASHADLAKFRKYIFAFKKYSLLNLSGKTVIVSSRTDEAVGFKYEFSSTKDFHEFHRESYFHVVIEHREVKKYFSFVWLEQPAFRKRFEYATFNANPSFNKKDAFNFWTGYIEPKKGDAQPFIDHMHKLLVGTKEEIDHAIKLLAYTVRYPHIRTDTSIGFRGVQGSGKTTVSMTMQALCPNHSRIIDSIDQIWGFNDHTIHVKYFLMEESVWGGDKAKEGQLKSAITAPTRHIGIKHVTSTTIPNYAFYIFTSNEDWIFPVDKGDRRFNIFDCTTTLVDDREYFNTYYTWLHGEGKHHLMHYFLYEIDLEGFDPKAMVVNQAKADVKAQSLRPVEKFLFNLLNSELSVDEIERQDWSAEIKVPREILFDFFKCNSAFASKVEIMEFSKTLGKIFSFPTNWASNWKGSKVKPFYRLPSRARAQECLARYMKEKPEHLFADYAANITQAAAVEDFDAFSEKASV